MRLDLNAAPQRLFEDRLQFLFLLGEEPGGLGRVCVRLEERGAARPERAIEWDLERAECVTVIELIHRNAFPQKLGRRRSRSVDRVVNPKLHLARLKRLPHRREILEIAAGVLDLAPAQFDFPLRPAHECLAPFRLARLRDVLS